jgi:hypothetical protein
LTEKLRSLRCSGLHVCEIRSSHSGGGAYGAFCWVRFRWSLTSSETAVRAVEKQIPPLRGCAAPVGMTIGEGLGGWLAAL